MKNRFVINGNEVRRYDYFVRYQKSEAGNIVEVGNRAVDVVFQEALESLRPLYEMSID